MVRAKKTQGRGFVLAGHFEFIKESFSLTGRIGEAEFFFEGFIFYFDNHRIGNQQSNLLPGPVESINSHRIACFDADKQAVHLAFNYPVGPETFNSVCFKSYVLLVRQRMANLKGFEVDSDRVVMLHRTYDLIYSKGKTVKGRFISLL